MEITFSLLVLAAFLAARILPARLGKPPIWFWGGAATLALIAYAMLGYYADNGAFEDGEAYVHPWLEPLLWLTPAALLGAFGLEVWQKWVTRFPGRAVICTAAILLVGISPGGGFAILTAAGLMWMLMASAAVGKKLPWIGPVIGLAVGVLKVVTFPLAWAWNHDRRPPKKKKKPRRRIQGDEGEEGDEG